MKVIRIVTYVKDGQIAGIFEFENKDIFTKKGKLKEPIAYYLKTAIGLDNVNTIEIIKSEE